MWRVFINLKPIYTDKKMIETTEVVIEQDKRVDLHATLSSLEIFQTAKTARKSQSQQILEPA